MENELKDILPLDWWWAAWRTSEGKSKVDGKTLDLNVKNEVQSRQAGLETELLRAYFPEGTQQVEE